MRAAHNRSRALGVGVCWSWLSTIAFDWRAPLRWREPPFLCSTGAEGGAIGGRLLQRLLLSDDELGDGLWSHQQLLEMNDRFVAAVELAFAKGLESRASASAIVKMNGKQRADEIAIELAWRWLRENMEANVDISFSEVVAFVNARCPGVDRARIGAEFKQRLMETRR